MGIFYDFTNVMLAEDLSRVEESGFEKPEEFSKIADRNCVQVCIYVCILNCSYNNVTSVANTV
jgi:hypothetical protein